MKTEWHSPVQYSLRLGDETVPLNDFLGKRVSLQFENQINCIACGRKTAKSFGQGFCYPCFMNSPENAECIIRPELCRGHLGEGRDPDWERQHHVQPHTVYLALSSEAKVGVTRDTQIPTRWIDQGASQALVLARTPNRYLAGKIEVEMKQFLTDKTNWQRMLKGEVSDTSLETLKNAMREKLSEETAPYFSEEETILLIEYPVLRYPAKVSSQSLDKVPTVSGVLTGIKAQYLLFDEGRVMNIRNHSGYLVTFSA